MYSPDVFYLQSTAEDRTKMSGMLEAAALWKPNKKQMFKPDLDWQPVALFYQKRENDTVKQFCISQSDTRRPLLIWILLLLSPHQ